MVCSGHSSAKLQQPPSTAQIKKTRAGANRSVNVAMANNKVPAINPNWTDAVSVPVAVGRKSKADNNEGITALLANHSEVQQN